ncbi:recombinase family protein [Dolichospermum circinale CS-537/01]|uniref:Recombinase family protein n=1 Tax=Dolichospermum circinale CS-537/01 TaxID=3021739 RepID=A0ABT5A824_9CYAN|nr:recombinase family protein [Dolichospermum circinale]MDB9488105.1 recombinase family protein [Dolichospermum circinale CS-537/01]
MLSSIWIFGTSRSGKTTRLLNQFSAWLQIKDSKLSNLFDNPINPTLNLHQRELGILLLAANDDNRRELADRVTTLTLVKHPIRVKTALGFFQDEVILFWPLLIDLLSIKAQFPVRLRPETEQELATKLWSSHLNSDILRRIGINEYRLVRRILDLWQLAAYSGVSCEHIPQILHSGIVDNSINLEPEFLGSLLLNWRSWCLERGLLTYGLITELYNQKLLTHGDYQQHLKQRYQGIIADDVDDYPAIAANLFEFLLNTGAVGAFSYNLDGAVRWGLGADPQYLSRLTKYCQVEHLTKPHPRSLGYCLTDQMVKLVTQPMTMLSLPSSVQPMQTTSRAELLRQTAQIIIHGVKSGEVASDEVAIIAPGLDAIARYTLVEILTKQNIAVESLNEQRPLISSSVVRALLTLIALVYPGLGRLVDRDAVAEMLVILSQYQTPEGEKKEFHHSRIDPVRAGLIADYCFVPHPDTPDLLSVKTFERWDRIGYIATQAYEQILQWIVQQRKQYHQRPVVTPVFLLYKAIQDFVCKDKNPSYQELSALRELIETAQHYWEIDTRLKQTDSLLLSLHTPETLSVTIAEFIQLLKRGTITANPDPVRSIGNNRKTVTLATIFQYRASKKNHRWHFWLDIGSPLWAKGGAATLFGANVFLQHRLGKPWTAADEQLAEEQRLQRIIADLLARVSDKLYLCHSDLAVNGQEQIGPLLPLVYACEGV